MSEILLLNEECKLSKYEARCETTADPNSIQRSFKLSNGALLEEIFTHIPHNVILNKGICGNGASKLFMEQDRHGILVMANVNTIKALGLLNPLSLGIYEERKKEDVLEYIVNNVNHIKLKFITTPLGISKIEWAVEQYNKTADNKIDTSTFFDVMLDEYHKTVTDYHYTKDYYNALLGVREKFQNVTLVSASPVEFSDPKLSGYSTIEILNEGNQEKQIRLIIAENFMPGLIKLLRIKIKELGKVFLYLNSVSAMREIMTHLSGDYPQMISLICADTKENRLKLEGYEDCLANLSSTPRKLNIYTESCNDSWSLKQQDPIMIFATDVNRINTRESINVRGFQWFGRPRNGYPAKELIHFTNTNEKFRSRTTLDGIQRLAQKWCALYNQLRSDLIESGIDYDTQASQLRSAWHTYSIFPSTEERPNSLLKINALELAQIDEARVAWSYYRKRADDKFISCDAIEQEWKRYSHIASKPEFCDEEWGKADKKLKREKPSERNKTKEVISVLTYFKNKPIGTKDHILYLKYSEKYKDTLKKYSDFIGYEKCEELKFNQYHIRKEYEKQSDEKTLSDPNFIQQVYNMFKAPGSYTNDEINKKLKPLGKRMGIFRALFADDIRLFFYTPEKKIETKVNGEPYIGWTLTGKRF